MKKQIITGAVISALALTWVYSSYASWDTSSTDTTTKTVKQMPELTDAQKAEMEKIKTILDKKKAGTTLTTDEQTLLDKFEANKPKRPEWNDEWRWDKWPWMLRDGWFWWIDELTDEEKTSLESMTDEQKQAFFEAKREAEKLKREAKESVIDKLLVWETLTADEEVVKAEIIKERAEQKTKKAEMETKMAAIKVILDKQKAWTTLTTEEQASLDSMKKEHKWNWSRWDFKNQSKDETSTWTSAE